LMVEATVAAGVASKSTSGKIGVPSVSKGMSISDDDLTVFARIHSQSGSIDIGKKN
jgi:hypothetical protein